MLKKIRLNRTNEYEKHIILEEISMMLQSFVEGRPHHLEIGSEQGEFREWDDIVIKTNNAAYIHIQVKRQTTDFSTDAIIRDTISKGKRKGQYKDLSVFDDIFKSLGEIISRNEANLKDFQKEFLIILPSEGIIEIKKGLQIRELREFMQAQIKDVTTTDGLKALDSENKSAKNIYNWLKTWCKFKDWDHILKAFRFLNIRYLRLEEEINDDVNKNLGRIFKSTEIKTVRSKIKTYLEDNATFTGAIRPRQLLYELREYLLPNIQRWTMFQEAGSSWNISGIHDLQYNDEIERPSVIVPALWDIGNQNDRCLRIQGICNKNCRVSESLIRLSLHPLGSFNIYCSDADSWNNQRNDKIGGTLGVTMDDLFGSQIIGRMDPFSASEFKELTTIVEKDGFAQNLHNEMYKNTLKNVDSKIYDKILEMGNSDLGIEVDKRWADWKSQFESDVEEQRKLFSKILHPNAEGKSISGELRVGPKTVGLLSEAIFFLLVVSVCLGDDNNKKWECVTDKLKMTSIGLAYWSGPGEEDRKVIEIDDDVGTSKLLEEEKVQILIISQSKRTYKEIIEDDIYGDNEKLGLLTSPNFPRLLVTKCSRFKKILRKGDITELKNYFQNNLDEYKNIIESAVNKVV